MNFSNVLTACSLVYCILSLQFSDKSFTSNTHKELIESVSLYEDDPSTLSYFTNNISIGKVIVKTKRKIFQIELPRHQNLWQINVP